MNIQQREFIQDQFLRPGVRTFHYQGDYEDLQGLYPTPDGLQLKRQPEFSASVTVTNADDLFSMFHDHVNDRAVFIGQDSSSIYTWYYSGGWVSNQIIAAVSTLGGNDGQNVLYHSRTLYVIGSDLDVYRGTSYTAALSNFYGSGNAQALCVHNDRVFMVTSGGEVFQLNDADTAFESIFTPTTDLNVVYFGSFSGSLLLVARSTGGALTFYRLTDNLSFTTLTHFDGASGSWATRGLPFAQYDGKLYFLSGAFVDPDGIYYTQIVYAFSGSQVIKVAEIPDLYDAAYAEGLLPWRDQLVFYRIKREASGLSTDQYFRTLAGEGFVTLDDLNDEALNSKQALAFSLNGEVYFLSSTSSVRRYRRLGFDELQDGVFESSRLDMGLPSRAKILNKIVVTMSACINNFKVIIKYRVDEEISWTTATTGNNLRRIEIANLGKRFYGLYLWIELDDDTGYDNDVRIDSISAVYSVVE